MKRLSTLLLLLGGSAAGSEVDDDRKSSRQAASGDEPTREITRGYYLKASPGMSRFLGETSTFLKPVTALNLSGGHDFVDEEQYSLAWELILSQALHNGPKETMDPDMLASNVRIQGDLYTFSALGMIEASTYPSRRFGVGVRAGGGVTLVPVLMEADAFAEIEEEWGTVSKVHAGPLATFGGGPTIEYYTKLAHFSVGADADLMYVMNLDIGLTATGYLKYTF